MGKFIFALITAMFFGNIGLHGQSANWKQFTNGEEIQDVLVSGQVIWVATFGGLVKIDRSAGKTSYYNKANSKLPGNFVKALAMDKNNRLWVATNHGLARIENNTWTIFDHNDHKNLRNINTLNISPDGSVWVGGNTLLKYDGTKWTKIQPPIYGVIMSIDFESDSTIWISTSGSPPGTGVASFDGSGWTSYTAENSKLPVGSPFIAGYFLTVDANDDKWIVLNYGEGLVRIRDTTISIYDTLNSDFPGLFPGPPKSIGNLIYMQVDKEVYSFDGTNWVNIKPSGMKINIQSVMTIREFSTGYIFGTREGLFLVDGNNFQILNTSNPIPFNSSGRLALKPDGSIAISYYDYLLQYDKGFWKKEPLLNYDKFDMEAGKDGELYFGSNNGLIIKDKSGEKNYTLANSDISSDIIWDVEPDSQGVWMGTREGLSFFDGTNFSNYKTGSSFFHVERGEGNTLYAAEFSGFSGNSLVQIWLINTSSPDPVNWKGLLPGPTAIKDIDIMKLNPSGELIVNANYEFYKYSNNSWSTIKPPTYVKADFMAFEGSTMWVAVNFGRLLKYDGSTWTSYTDSTSPLPSENFADLIVDTAGNKWISTGRTLTVFNENGVLLSTPKIKKHAKDAGIKIYPNPAQGEFRVKLNGFSGREVDVRIYNMEGKEVSAKFNIPVIDDEVIRGRESSLKPGIYLLRVAGGTYSSSGILMIR